MNGECDDCGKVIATIASKSQYTHRGLSICIKCLEWKGRQTYRFGMGKFG